MIHIHYIEDNPVDQLAFIREIEKKKLPYLVDISSSINEARERNLQYDLILCDYYLPDGSIIDIISDLVTGGAPVIVVTCQADMANAITAMKLGAKDYLIKDLSRQYLSVLPIQIENLLKNRKVELEREWLSALFNSIAETIPYGMYLYEPRTDRVVYYNPAFLSVWEISDAGYAMGDQISHSDIWKAITNRVGYEGVDTQVLPGDIPDESDFHIDGEIRVRENKTIKFYTCSVLYQPGTSPCYVCFFEDSSEMSRVRESLYQYSLELESLNATLDQRVQERTEQIETLMRKKNDMILSIGHDIRTPLTPLIALLPQLYDQEANSKKKDKLAILCDCAKKIHSLSESALKIASLGSEFTIEGDHQEPCIGNLRLIMETVITRHLPEIEKKGLRVINNTPDTVITHVKPAHIGLILDNLIHNALQYTNPGGSISLHGGTDDNSIWFCVSDTGIGLKTEHASQIFDEFYKVDSARNNLSSHGIGLSVVKKLVILNNGHITVMSEGPGKGSRFCVSLPEICNRSS